MAPADTTSGREVDFLTRYLDAHAIHCPACGEALRGVRDAKCPACSGELRIVLRLSEPVLRCWIVTATALLAAAGVGIFALVVCAKEGWPSGRRGGSPALQLVLVYFIANIPLAIAALLWRRRFVRLPRSTQRLLAFGAVICSTAAMVVLLGAGG